MNETDMEIHFSRLLKHGVQERLSCGSHTEREYRLSSKPVLLPEWRHKLKPSVFIVVYLLSLFLLLISAPHRSPLYSVGLYYIAVLVLKATCSCRIHTYDGITGLLDL